MGKHGGLMGKVGEILFLDRDIDGFAFKRIKTYSLSGLF
jgi:hypothetical protein